MAIPLRPDFAYFAYFAFSALTRAICKAFGLQSKTTQFDLLCTSQIGSWSADTVPVILTVQWNGHELPAVIAELALRLSRPLILLACEG